jgi:hypothetical protein
MPVGNELAKDCRHCAVIVGHEKPTSGGSYLQNLNVGFARENGLMRGLKIEKRFAAAHPVHDASVEVGVGEEPYLHFCFCN